MCEKDIDARVYKYLRAKFPNHSLSSYEEASAFLTFMMWNEVYKLYDSQMRKAIKRH